MKRLLGSIRNASQKNSRFLYYARQLPRLLVPAAACRRRLGARLRDLRLFDEDQILDRVNYYCRPAAAFALGTAGAPYRFSLFRGQRNYHLDLREYLRFFDPDLNLLYRFGDETAVPDLPTIVKARPIDGNNGNSVLFNLNKVRHFAFATDRLAFADKLDRLVWRGGAHQENRKWFLERFHGHPRCDVGQVRRKPGNAPWQKGYLSISDQLKCKFILSIEGNDVASNLKWILSSNSLCFMVRPRFETWFMEGRLVPGRHYVLLRDDYADLDEKMDYYANHAPEALEIVARAQRFVAGFRNPAEEDLVSLLVLKKYFELSGQPVAVRS